MPHHSLEVAREKKVHCFTWTNRITLWFYIEPVI